MTRTIRVDALERVEGHGALSVRLEPEGARVTFAIDEPPRFFEGWLAGRHYAETPDLVARICGLCPAAHQVTACRALERAAGLEPPAAARSLRRMLYLGEWLVSHAVHLFMLHAPDFLGLGGAAALASREPEMMRAGAALRAAGARIVEVVGGRTVHPVSLRVGGFGRLPRPAELEPLRPVLEKGLEEATRTVRWVSQFPFPPHRGEWELVALAHPEDYPVEEGAPATDSGRRLSADGFLQAFAKEQLPHSTALHLRPASGGVHLVGPLARYSLNHDRLPPRAAELAREAGLESPCRNPFRSILVRAVEMAMACEECLRLLESYPGPEPQPRAPESFSGSGEALTEAPRGVLHHRYQVSEGRITEAEITTPTAHNQAAVEADLQDVARRSQGMPEDQLRRLCDQTVRNYDPCLSCSTH